MWKRKVSASPLLRTRSETPQEVMRTRNQRKKLFHLPLHHTNRSGSELKLKVGSGRSATTEEESIFRSGSKGIEDDTKSEFIGGERQRQETASEL
jgi:hypothetical protein